MSNFTESTVEEAALGWLKELRYDTLFGPDIAFNGPAPERESYGQVVLAGRLREAMARLNPKIPKEAQEEALRKVRRLGPPSLVEKNRTFHKMLTDGVEVEYKRPDGTIAGDRVVLVDFREPKNNDWLAVNQFTVEEDKINRRPDIVIFLNGLPLAVIELKNPTDANATLWTAFGQLQTYKMQIPSLFTYNEALVVSDGVEARMGTLTAGKEWFLPWRTIEGEALAQASMPQLEVLIKGAFEKRRFLDLVRHFVVFEDTGKGLPAKIMAGYHQFHAVAGAVQATVEASGPKGDRRCGVIWHTQGSGKSLTMAFYAGRIVLDPTMKNPTIVVITDRNDLDDQLFKTFSRCHDIIRQKPVQAESRADLRQKLKVASGGVVFTTVHKFFPEGEETKHPLLTDRENVIVIADEAHRSQYDFVDGFARHMREALPNASFIGFTGTPIELADRNTRAVFGDYISIYDIQRAVQDGATVAIYYESRLAKIELDEAERPKIDLDFEEVTEDEEEEVKKKLKTKWARMEKLVGAEKRIGMIAADLVAHFEKRLEVMEGKAMVVCMSRRICVDLHDAIVKLRPRWYAKDDAKGALKVVMTGSASDKTEWQEHIRNKERREKLAERFKDPADPMKIVIVRDMWLTGFDAPCLHTMYVDKPMKGHGLMQAIARVNRVFKDKPGGLVVDYLGLADSLRKALAAYTESGGKGKTAVDQTEAVAVMLEKFEVVEAMFHGFDYGKFITGKPAERLAVIPEAMEFLLRAPDPKKKEEDKRCFMKAVTELSQAFALSVPHEDALRLQDQVGFFQAVRASFAKNTESGRRSEEDMETAIQQIVSRAVAPDKVVDIFAAAGLKKPDISILSDTFLADVKSMPQKNLAVEVLRKLLEDEVKVRSRRNSVQSRKFSEMLEQAIRAYQNRALVTAEIIEKLIDLAKEMKAADKRGEKLGLSEEEVAFYDALETNDSAVKVLGDATLRTIARELVDTVRKNASIDWTLRESVQANLRRLVRRTLRKYGYPPDKQEKATQTVLQQAELLCKDWAA